METIRNGGLATIHSTALDARQRFVDVVAHSATYQPDGTVDVSSDQTGWLTAPTAKAHRQLAERADVPTKFYERIRSGHGELWAHTMNDLAPKRPTLFRMIVSGDDTPDTLRAVMSDRYEIIDNVYVLTTLLGAFTDAGLGGNDLEVMGDFDAADGYLRLRCTVPAIGVNARDLVEHYRSPYDGRTGAELPMVFAGLELSNSETGNGAYSIKPRLVMQVCRNGMTRDVAGELFRQVHLGSRLERGVITWSDETRQRQLELVSSAARDAITTFISPEYVRRVVNEMSAAAGIEVADTTAAIAKVVDTCQLTDDEARSVLDAFVRSADMSVLGLAQAVTATAQVVPDGERQSELEAAFWAIVNNAEAHAGA